MQIQEIIDAPPVRMPAVASLPRQMVARRGMAIDWGTVGLLIWSGAGLLLWLCYFPVACGWLAWIALVPLLCLVRSTARPSRVYLSAWVAGSAFFWTALSWMRVADERMYATWAMLAVYCSLYFPLTIWLLRFFDRRARWPLIFMVPVVWTALEFLRAHLMTGFAWYFLAHTQHDFLPMIQIADLGGAYAVTFLVAAVNAMVFEWLYRSARLRRWFSLAEPAVPPRRWQPVLQTVVLLALLAGTLFYGLWRLGQNDFATGPKVALIQSNLDQRLRNTAAPGSNSAERMVIHNRQLSDRAASMSPDLIVWPETSYPEDWVEVSPDLLPEEVPLEWRHLQAESKQLARLIASRWHCDVLLGMNAEELGADGKRSRTNAAVLIQSDGWPGGRYDKMHRVPFGEFIPLRESLPFMDRFSPYDFDYSIRPGKEFTRFSLKNSYITDVEHRLTENGRVAYTVTRGQPRFGVIICYEDTDPLLARQYVRPGDDPPVDFLINISNDGWFNGSCEHEEHLAICRFRAVECRRSIARAVNMGVSAVIDGNGRVLWPDTYFQTWPDGRTTDWNYSYTRIQFGGVSAIQLELMKYFPSLRPDNSRDPSLTVREWPHFKQVAGVLISNVPVDTRTSLYGRFGDWLPWTCWAFVGMSLACGLMRRASPSF